MTPSRPRSKSIAPPDSRIDRLSLGRLPRVRVLVVEDNPGDADLVAENLADSPHAEFVVTCATRLDAALALASAESFDALIVDLELPDSKGLSTLRAMRSAAPSAPIIVVSGHDAAELAHGANEAGADEVIAKSDANTPLFSRSVLYLVERHKNRAARTALEGLLAGMPDAVLVITVEGRVVYVNDAATSLFGRSREALLAEPLEFSVVPGMPSEVTVLRDGQPRQCELRVNKVEGWKEATLVASLRDVTDQRQLETQLALSDRMVSIGTLAAGVAHEINTPLASIISNIELATAEVTALGQAAPSDLRDELEDARDSAERVRLIVRDLNVFARAEEDRLEVVDVHPVLESSLRMARNEIRHRAQLVRAYTTPLPRVQVNPARLGQVILNLVVNAAQSIPEGRAEENTIRVETCAASTGDVSISIADTGSGMTEAVQRRLFTAFFTTKRQGTGTGLGLAISQRIIASFSGKIGFKSAEGAGTTFTITLPAVATAATEAQPTAPQAVPASAPGGRRGRVLVVDDEPALTTVMSRMLRPDHDVTVVDGGAHALEVLRTQAPFDVVLCDVMMPDVTGIELYQTVREHDPRTADRFVFMTGGAFTVAARELLDSFPNQLLEKPFAPQHLRELVAKLVRDRR